GGEERAVEAVRPAVAQHPRRAAVELVGAIRNLVQEGLDEGRGVEAGEEVVRRASLGLLHKRAFLICSRVRTAPSLTSCRAAWMMRRKSGFVLRERDGSNL